MMDLRGPSWTGGEGRGRGGNGRRSPISSSSDLAAALGVDFFDAVVADPNPDPLLFRADEYHHRSSSESGGFGAIQERQRRMRLRRRRSSSAEGGAGESSVDILAQAEEVLSSGGANNNKAREKNDVGRSKGERSKHHHSGTTEEKKNKKKERRRRRRSSAGETKEKDHRRRRRSSNATTGEKKEKERQRRRRSSTTSEKKEKERQRRRRSSATSEKGERQRRRRSSTTGEKEHQRRRRSSGGGGGAKMTARRSHNGRQSAAECSSESGGEWEVWRTLFERDDDEYDDEEERRERGSGGGSGDRSEMPSSSPSNEGERVEMKKVADANAVVDAFAEAFDVDDYSRPTPPWTELSWSELSWSPAPRMPRAPSLQVEEEEEDTEEEDLVEEEEEEEKMEIQSRRMARDLRLSDLRVQHPQPPSRRGSNDSSSSASDAGSAWSESAHKDEEKEADIKPSNGVIGRGVSGHTQATTGLTMSGHTVFGRGTSGVTQATAATAASSAAAAAAAAATSPPAQQPQAQQVAADDFDLFDLDDDGADSTESSDYFEAMFAMEQKHVLRILGRDMQGGGGSNSPGSSSSSVGSALNMSNDKDVQGRRDSRRTVTDDDDEEEAQEQQQHQPQRRNDHQDKRSDEELRTNEKVDRLIDMGNDAYSSEDYVRAKTSYLRALAVQNEAIERRVLCLRHARRQAGVSYRRRKSADVNNPKFDASDTTDSSSDAVDPSLPSSSKRLQALASRRERRTACLLHKRLGDAYGELGRTDKAHGHYQLALHRAFPPAPAPASALIAGAANKKPRAPPPAEEELRIASEIVLGLGDLYAGAGLHDRALCRYNEALRLSERLSSRSNGSGSNKGMRDSSVVERLAARRAFGAHEALAAEALEGTKREVDFDTVFFHYREMMFLEPRLSSSSRNSDAKDGSSSASAASLMLLKTQVKALLSPGGGAGGNGGPNGRSRRASLLSSKSTGTIASEEPAISFLAEAKKSLKQMGQIGTKEQVVSLMDDMAFELIDLGRTHDAIRCHEEKLDLLRRCAVEHSDHESSVDVLVDLGHLCTSARRHVRASEYFAEALKVSYKRQYLDVSSDRRLRKAVSADVGGSVTLRRKMSRRRSSLTWQGTLESHSTPSERQRRNLPPATLGSIAGWLAASHIYADDRSAAVQYCEEYLLMCPPEERPGVLCAAGLLYATGYRLAEAIDCYERAMEMINDSSQGGGGARRGDRERLELVRGLKDAFPPHAGAGTRSGGKDRALKRRRRRSAASSGDDGRYEAFCDARDGRTVLIHLGLVQLGKLLPDGEAEGAKPPFLSSSPRSADGLKRRERNNPGADIVAAAIDLGRKAEASGRGRSGGGGGGGGNHRGGGGREPYGSSSDTDTSSSSGDDSGKQGEDATSSMFDHFRVLHAMGNILLRRNRHSEAIQYFERCLSELAAPSSAEWVILSRFVVPRQEHFRLHADAGVCYLEMWQENDLSLRHFENALEELEKCREGSERKASAAAAANARRASLTAGGRPSPRASPTSSALSPTTIAFGGGSDDGATKPHQTLKEQLGTLVALGGDAAAGGPSRGRDNVADDARRRKARHLAALALCGMGWHRESCRILEELANDDDAEDSAGSASPTFASASGYTNTFSSRLGPDRAAARIDLAYAARASAAAAAAASGAAAGAGDALLSREESWRLFEEGTERLLGEDGRDEERLSPDHPLAAQARRMRELFFSEDDDDDQYLDDEYAKTTAMAAGGGTTEPFEADDDLFRISTPPMA